jgi:hypothetical protein
MNFYAGISRCMSLTCFVFNSSLLGQKGMLNCIVLLIIYNSGFGQNLRGNQRIVDC